MAIKKNDTNIMLYKNSYILMGADIKRKFGEQTSPNQEFKPEGLDF